MKWSLNEMSHDAPVEGIFEDTLTLAPYYVIQQEHAFQRSFLGLLSRNETECGLEEVGGVYISSYNGTKWMFAPLFFPLWWEKGFFFFLRQKRLVDRNISRVDSLFSRNC